MKMLTFVFLACTAVWADTIAAPACAPGTLAAYIALGAGGCSVSALPRGPLEYSDFGFRLLASSVGVTHLTAHGITITPLTVKGDVGLEITAAGFSVTGTQFVKYLISYVLDPKPPIPRGLLLLDPVVPPGLASVSVANCLGAQFVAAGCLSGPPVVLNVFDNGVTSQLRDNATLPATALIGVEEIITLSGNGASASIIGYRDVVTPEPATWLLLGAALLGLILFSRVRA